MQISCAPLNSLRTISEEDFRRPWPKWAKRAAARVLQLLLPVKTTKQWLECFEGDGPFDTFDSLMEGGWVWGRLARYRVEWREKEPEIYKMFSQWKWIDEITNGPEGLTFKYHEGFEKFLLRRFEKVMGLPLEFQEKFWNYYNTGFGQKLDFRRQDAKAFRIYLFLAMTWPAAQQCTSIRQLHDFLFSIIPQEPCPPGLDPIDFDERQIKWFEKICHRNLGLSLAKRGRPARKR